MVDRIRESEKVKPEEEQEMKENNLETSKKQKKLGKHVWRFQDGQLKWTKDFEFKFLVGQATH